MSLGYFNEGRIGSGRSSKKGFSSGEVKRRALAADSTKMRPEIRSVRQGDRCSGEVPTVDNFGFPQHPFHERPIEDTFETKVVRLVDLGIVRKLGPFDQGCPESVSRHSSLESRQPVPPKIIVSSSRMSVSRTWREMGVQHVGPLPPSFRPCLVQGHRLPAAEEVHRRLRTSNK